MYRIFLCLMAVLNFTALFAQKSILKFNTDGNFKIVQFTDTHYKVDDQANSQVALDRMNEVLDAEKPDFVIFTGDVVVSNESFKGLDTVLDVCMLLYLVIMMMNMIILVRNYMIILQRSKVV